MLVSVTLAFCQTKTWVTDTIMIYIYIYMCVCVCVCVCVWWPMKV